MAHLNGANVEILNGEAELQRAEETCRLERKPDGRCFIVVGNHNIPRNFIWSVKIETSVARTWDLIVTGVGGPIEVCYAKATPEGRKRIEALRDRIIHLWIEA